MYRVCISSYRPVESTDYAMLITVIVNTIRKHLRPKAAEESEQCIARRSTVDRSSILELYGLVQGISFMVVNLKLRARAPHKGASAFPQRCNKRGIG